MKQQKVIEMILLAVIALSVGFIGWKFYLRSTSSPPTAAGGTANLPEPIHPGDSNVPVFTNPGDEVKVTPSITEADWEKALEKFGLQKAEVKSSPSCGDESPYGLLPLHDRKTGDNLLSGATNVVSGFSRPFCFRVGDKLPLAFWSPKAEEAVLEYRGTLEINHILSAKQGEIPPPFYGAFGLDAGKFAENIVRVREGEPDRPVLIVRVKPLITSGAAPPALPPPGFPWTEILTTEMISARRAKGMNISIIDVRSEAEFSKKKIESASNSPYVLPKGISDKFSWSVRNSDLSTATFSLDKAAAVRDKGQIVIVGSGPSDPRPIYALQHLVINGYKGLGWIYAGVPAK